MFAGQSRSLVSDMFLFVQSFLLFAAATTGLSCLSLTIHAIRAQMIRFRKWAVNQVLYHKDHGVSRVCCSTLIVVGFAAAELQHRSLDYILREVRIVVCFGVFKVPLRLQRAHMQKRILSTANVLQWVAFVAVIVCGGFFLTILRVSVHSCLACSSDLSEMFRA